MTNDSDCQILSVEWGLNEEISNDLNVPANVTKKVIELLDNGNTVPFISRYRKEVTRGLQPEVIHAIKDRTEQLRAVINTVQKSMNNLHLEEPKSNKVKAELARCKTIREVEMIMEPYKSRGPKTLAARAIEAGLEPLANRIMTGSSVDIAMDISESTKCFYETPKLAEEGIVNIISFNISKHLAVIRATEAACDIDSPFIVCAKKRVYNADKMTESQKNARDFDLKNFSKYMDFRKPVKRLLAHNVLAINRAEARNVISVSIEFPSSIRRQFNHAVLGNITRFVHSSHSKLLDSAADDAWKRFIQPHLSRAVRSRMTELANQVSVQVFQDNLRRILMMAPLTSKTIPSDLSQSTSFDSTLLLGKDGYGDRLPVMGLDPGYRCGCKWAACNPYGDVLGAGVVYIPEKPHGSNSLGCKGANEFINVMMTYRINSIALGSGCGSRETEIWLNCLINSGEFKNLRVRYSMVSENGASIYSADPLAAKELPNLDVSLRGAVSIARRLQDPMSELVKIDPKHLGVGMYQHDLNQKMLNQAVTNVLEECISFVGLDLNLAPLHMLSRVAGLTRKRAEAIISYRAQHGGFHSRHQLLKVKGIGSKTFAQCAGFLRVRPAAQALKRMEDKNQPFNLLDETLVEEKFSSSKTSTQLACNKMDLQNPKSCSSQNVIIIDTMNPIPIDKKRRIEKMECSSIPSKKRLCRLKKEEKEEDVIFIDDTYMTDIELASTISSTSSYETEFSNDDSTSLSESSFNFNPLDQTAVHPHSYHVAEKIISNLHWNLTDVGTSPFIERINVLKQDPSVDTFLMKFAEDDIGIETLKDILDFLSRPLNFDERQNLFEPLFRENSLDPTQIKLGTKVLGRVSNVATFGAFVECGIGEDAFVIPSDFPKTLQMETCFSFNSAQRFPFMHQSLQLGDRIEGEICQIDRWSKGKIGRTRFRINNIRKFDHDKAIIAQIF